VPQLLRAADTAAEMHVPGASKEFTAHLFAFTWDPLVAALKKEPDSDIQATCAPGGPAWGGGGHALLF
jgi:hypothetical protein